MADTNNALHIRFADRSDAGLILRFIRELAEFEELLHEVVATEEGLAHSIFDQRGAEVLIAEIGQEPVGFALFFHNYSTFLGRRGIYLEDLYVTPERRGAGIGRAMLQRLAQITKERDCGRLEWWVLVDNAPAIQFYDQINARQMKEWVVYRLAGDSLEDMAARGGPKR